MEPAQAKIKILLGEFPVVDHKLDGLTVHLGGTVYITMHLGDLQHEVKPGDKLPLFTEITCPPLPITNPTNTPSF